MAPFQSMFLRRGLLVLLAAASASASGAAPIVQLDAWGRDSIRVRIAPPGGAIVEPPLQALLTPGPPPSPASRRSALGLANGDLQVTFDAATGFINASRVSDGAALLVTNSIAFGPPAAYSRAGSVSSTITFAGHGPSERIYGMGEHRTGTVQQMPFSQLFQTSGDYGISHGSDSLIPYYGSSLGYGFLWNLPSFGFVNLSASGLLWASNASLNIDFWVTVSTAGVEPFTNMLGKMVDVVGHAPLMPFYATGFIQCKDRYRNQSQLLAVANGYAQRGLPVSVLVVDWMHWSNMGDWTFNPTCWCVALRRRATWSASI